MGTFQMSIPEPGLYVFTCWNPEFTGCGVFSVRGEVARDANIKAMEECGQYAATPWWSRPHLSRGEVKYHGSL